MVVGITCRAFASLRCGSLRELEKLITDAGRTVGNVLLQYPLHARIIGIIMTATGLVEVFSRFLAGISIGISTPATLGAGPALVIMGIAYGDQWTNMIQSFWTIPLLAIADLTVRDIMGYTTITLFVGGAVMLATLLLVGFA